MKNLFPLSPALLLVILWVISGMSYAQTTFDLHTIEAGFPSPSGIYAADIDMDGDVDVVAGSGTNGVAWWRNDGGNPLQWTKQFIDVNSGSCLTVFVADIIRDGQPDVIAASSDKNQIIYYKNMGGDPITWSKQIISTAVTGPHEVFVCDFDLDGNQDVFAACMESNEISWWHNNGGDPATWTKQQITGNFPGARSVHVADIDGDGDQDVAGAALDSDELVWWINNGGSPVSWSKQTLSNTFDGAHRVQIADMDNDGDMDILGTAYMASEISIWRNDGGTPITWTKHTIDNTLTGAVIGFAKDLDNDGLLDILGSAQASNTVVWYRNRGGDDILFDKKLIDEDFAGVWPALAADLDNDLDADIIAGGFDANEIRWYENKQVGRFTNRIKIGGVDTDLGLFVPEEYDPAQKYKLIVALHICGDENEYSRYRDNMIPTAIELNAILVAPDCHNTITNLGVPDEAYILQALEYAKKRFSIDEEYIYLTGGSCNGRTVLKYGLDKIYPFRGIIPFNPYLPDLQTGYYDFSSDMAVCFASGTQDPSYVNSSNAYNQLMANMGKAAFNSMPGIGHVFYIPEFTEEMLECINLIDSIHQSTSGISSRRIDKQGIHVFPNPFCDYLQIQIPQSSQETISISITNLVGQVVYSHNTEPADHTQYVQLDLSVNAIPSGLYILNIIQDGILSRQKIIKE